LSDRSVPEGSGKHGEHPQKPPTVADAAFCELVARDMGVKVSAARTAFMGEPTARVKGVVEWAMDRSEDPEERSRMVVAWARKRGCGAFRSDDEYVSLAGSVGVGHMANRRENEALAHLLLQYWCSNPRRLARLLDELEIWINVTEELRDAADGGEE
jgi:hypothetical protein